MNGRNTPTTTLRVTRPIDPFYSNSIVSIFGLPLSFDYAYFLHFCASFGPILEFRSGEFDSPNGRRTFAEVLFQSAQSARAMLQQPGLEVDGVVYKFLPKSNGEVLSNSNSNSNSKGKTRSGANSNQGGGRNRRSPWEDGEVAMGGNRSRGSGKRGTMNEGGKGRGGAQSGAKNQQQRSNPAMRMGPQLGQQLGQMGQQMGQQQGMMGPKQGGTIQPMMIGQQQQQQQQGMKQQGSMMMANQQQSMGQSMGQPMGQPMGQSMGQSMGQPMSAQLRQQPQPQPSMMGQGPMMLTPQGMMGQQMSQQGMYQQGMMMSQPQSQPSMMSQPQPGLVPSESCVLADDFYAHFDVNMVLGVFRSFGPIAQVVFVSEKCV